MHVFFYTARRTHNRYICAGEAQWELDGLGQSPQKKEKVGFQLNGTVTAKKKVGFGQSGQKSLMGAG